MRSLGMGFLRNTHRPTCCTPALCWLKHPRVDVCHDVLISLLTRVPKIGAEWRNIDFLRPLKAGGRGGGIMDTAWGQDALLSSSISAGRDVSPGLTHLADLAKSAKCPLTWDTSWLFAIRFWGLPSPRGPTRLEQKPCWGCNPKEPVLGGAEKPSVQ